MTTGSRVQVLRVLLTDCEGTEAWAKKFPSTSVMGTRVHWQHVHCYDDRGRPLCLTDAAAGGPCHGQL